jgi:tRNA A37 threonylcarbamoyladenosine dehydratase
MFYGRDGFERLRKSFVAVVGLGGVGACACEALARAGVGRLRIIDCDVVKPSDTNRQLIALSTNTGLPKVEAASERLLAINPRLEIDARNSFFHRESASGLLTPDLSFVIDAIDSLAPKGELIRHCTTEGIPVISSMGAAGRSDPAAIRIAALADTRNCRLARALRRYLHTHDVSTAVPVVYSTEQPAPASGDNGPDTGPALETSGTYLRGRPRASLPSLPTIPAIFGLFAANYVILELLKGEQRA